MLIRQLQYLVALAEAKHFARAAERCDISQPTLSLSLRQLEDELGVPIVERGNRFRGFTSEGEIVLEWARRIISAEVTLKQELDFLRGSLAGRLRLGVIPSAIAAIPKLATAFTAAFPRVTIDQAEMTSIDILRDLAAFELDAAITYIDNEPLGNVRTLPMYTEQFVLATPVGTPLGALDEVSWTQAAALPLCLLRRDMQNRRIIDGIFASLGMTPVAGIEASSMISQFCYVQSGHWSSIIPASFASWLEPVPGLHIARLVEPVVTKSVGLVIADREPLSPLVRSFWEHIERSSVT